MLAFMRYTEESGPSPAGRSNCRKKADVTHGNGPTGVERDGFATLKTNKTGHFQRMHALSSAFPQCFPQLWKTRWKTQLPLRVPGAFAEGRGTVTQTTRLRSTPIQGRFGEAGPR